MSDDFAQAVAATDPKYNAQECADVKAWTKRIETARKFDEPARKQMALDRRYARGDAGDFEVNVNLPGSYVDILKALLYARNPDLDVQPSEATNPPPMADIIDMAREQLGTDPATHQEMEKAGMQATMQAQQAKQIAMSGAQSAVLDPQAKAKIALAAADPAQDPAEIGERAAQAWLDQAVKAKAKEIMEPHRKRQSDAKQFGRTIELVVSNLWRKGNLKKHARQQVGSAITVSAGWLKVTWQERKGQDQTVAQAIRDAQDQLARLEMLQADVEEAKGNDLDQKRQEIELTLQGLEAKVEIIIARGIAIDFVRAEDVQVSLDVESLENYADASWIAHRVFMATDDAKAKFPAVADKIGKANSYKQNKPKDPSEARGTDPTAAKNIDAKEADAYTLGETLNGGSDGDGSVCVWEVQDKQSGMLRTLIEGMDVYARAPFPVKPNTTRFYSLFMLAFIWVDGERHPQSLIKRGAPLFDDVNRLYSNRALHRRRSIPKTAFNTQGMDPKEAAKLSGATTQEMVGVSTINPDAKIADLVAPIHYAPIDENLYDDRPTMLKLESIFGIQEALTSSVDTTKTATEAEIQQTGTNARSTFKRAAIDEMLDDLALYTTEIALEQLTHDDVTQIAGPWAFWPKGLTLQDMGTLVTVQIKGGSSGKPDTSAQQQVWATVYSLLDKSVLEIGQLRGSTPEDIADCKEELIVETLSRTGDRLDADRFLPKSPSYEPGQMPTQAPPGQPPLGAQPPQPGTPNVSPMPAQQTPPPNPNTLPVPHGGHVLSQQGHIEPPNGAHP
jgi:hypothetical protein